MSVIELMRDAVLAGDVAAARGALAAGCDPNANLAPVMRGARFPDMPPLLTAVESWNAELVETLVAAGARARWNNLIVTDRDGSRVRIGSSLLLIAMENLHRAGGSARTFGRVVSALAGGGCDVDAPNAAGLRPLQVAVMNGASGAMVRTLLRLMGGREPPSALPASTVAAAFLNHEALAALIASEDGHSAALPGSAPNVLAITAAYGPQGVLSQMPGTAYGQPRRVPAHLEPHAPRLVALFAASWAMLTVDPGSGEPDESGNALKASVRRGAPGLVRWLAGQARDPLVRTTRIAGALRTAARWAQAESVAALIELNEGAGVTREFGGNLLHDAAQYTHEEPGDIAATLRLLVAAGADVNALNDNGVTALHIAAEASHGAGTARALIEAGACVDAPGEGGRSPLDMAALSGNTDTVALLLEAGADPHSRNGGDSLLHRAARGAATDAQMSDTLRRLARAGIDVNNLNDAGQTPLDVATSWKQPAAVRTLLELGADPDLGQRGQYAAYEGDEDRVEAIAQMLAAHRARRSLDTLSAPVRDNPGAGSGQ